MGESREGEYDDRMQYTITRYTFTVYNRPLSYSTTLSLPQSLTQSNDSNIKLSYSELNTPTRLKQSIESKNTNHSRIISLSLFNHSLLYYISIIISLAIPAFILLIITIALS